jgi:hypothetical protein
VWRHRRYLEAEGQRRESEQVEGARILEDERRKAHWQAEIDKRNSRERKESVHELNDRGK